MTAILKLSAANRREIERFRASYFVHPIRKCWIWTRARSAKGYGSMFIGGRYVSAHRASYILHRGPISDPGLYVCHRCDTPSCVNPDHLFLGTPRDNTNDRRAKGRSGDLRGERNGRARLTPSDVAKLRASSEPTASLALTFGISVAQVRRIRTGLQWRHL